MQTLTFDYKPKTWIMFLVIAFFGGCAWVFANLALTNDRGLILNRILEFSESGASMFYWVCFVLCLAFVLAGVLGLVKSFGKAKQVVLSPDGISAPKSAVSKVIIDIPYSEVVDIVDQQVQKQVFLSVHGRNAKVTINQSALASKELFQELRSTLIERVNQQQG